MKDRIKKLLREKVENTITCKKCGWHWDKSESSKEDLYLCHKCGYNNLDEAKVLNYLKDTTPIKDTDKIRVYHGFYSANDAIIVLKYGLSGQERASRVYSYEYGNNPKGLFVSADFNVVKKNFSGKGIIIEFETLASNLEAPVWAGQDNFFVQGQYTKSFKSPEERDAETLRKREKYRAEDPEGKYAKGRISKSDRPELAQSLYDNVEKQALFVGNLNPNEIKNVWFNEGHYFRNRTNEPWKRYSRREFLIKFGDILMKDAKGSDRHQKANAKIFKPNDDLTIDKLKEKANQENWDYNNLIDVLKRDSYYKNMFLFPKQIKQFNELFPTKKDDDTDEIDESTNTLSEIINRNELKQMIKKIISEQRIQFKMELPNDILQIKNVLKKNDYKLYVVGGAVRDALLNKTPKDFDLVTDAVPDVVETMLHDAGFKTVPTGKAFGVINVFTDSGEYEIATMREDIGSGRRPDSVKFTNIETDVKRRDLTVNALFYDIDTNEIVDLVGGVDDLKNGVIKTVGNPEDRFSEDRLRILRAIRFAARFGSELDANVNQALKNDSSLEGISAERIKDEFIKGIASSKSVKYFMSLIDNFNLFNWILKGLNVNKNFIENNDYILVLSVLLSDNDPKVVQKQLNNLKYSVEEIRDIVFLISLIDLTPENAVQLKKMQRLTNLTDEQIEKFGIYKNINNKTLDAFLRFNLTVNGNDLMDKLNLKPGKELGDAINKAEYNNFLKLL